jgi:hypothetical protein
VGTLYAPFASTRLTIVTNATGERPPQFEPLSDDVMIMRIRSTGGGAEGGNTIALMTERAKQGPYYLVADFRQLQGSFDRKMHEEGPKLVDPKWLLGVAYVGAPMPLRLLLKVFNLAMFLTGRGDFPYEFADDESQALAFFERLRKHRKSA